MTEPGLQPGSPTLCDTVLSVPLDDLPDWLPAWCLDHLGGEPVGVLFQVQQISMVFGLRLAGGRDVVDLPRAFRTADLWLIHAADCCSRYSSWTCCGVRY